MKVLVLTLITSFFGFNISSHAQIGGEWKVKKIKCEKPVAIEEPCVGELPTKIKFDDEQKSLTYFFADNNSMSSVFDCSSDDYTRCDLTSDSFYFREVRINEVGKFLGRSIILKSFFTVYGLTAELRVIDWIGDTEKYYLLYR